MSNEGEEPATAAGSADEPAEAAEAAEAAEPADPAPTGWNSFFFCFPAVKKKSLGFMINNEKSK